MPKQLTVKTRAMFWEVHSLKFNSENTALNIKKKKRWKTPLKKAKNCTFLWKHWKSNLLKSKDRKKVPAEPLQEQALPQLKVFCGYRWNRNQSYSIL